MSRPRYLTKSRYKLAQECPTKLYYADRPNEYENKKLDDDFLKALAHGGFQVGALARLYFPGGTEVTEQTHDAAVKLTDELLARPNVVIYEAAFRHENLFIRADVVVKRGNEVQLIEVKAKSFERGVDEFFNKTLLKKGQHKINGDWREYLYDIAFQTHVCQRAHAHLQFQPYLMLADKASLATVEGLNQKFLLIEEGGRTRVQISGAASPETVGNQILCQVDVSHPVKLIHDGLDLGDKSRSQLGLKSFADEIAYYADHHARAVKIEPEVSAKCKGCEFRTAPDAAKKSGFKECWAATVPASDIDGPFVFDIWNFRKSDKLLQERRPLLKQVTQTDIDPKADDKPGLSMTQRQWIQVELALKGALKPHVNLPGLASEIRSWKFPYHFIDFETTMAALPFNSGRRPYEQLAFQFSHHVVQADGRIEHVGQYLHEKRGHFPNFDFLRALKAQLGKDSGTIFRYSNHENTVLCQILAQLGRSQENDREELMAWIKTITKSPGSADEEWEGARNMVDLWEVLKRHYYHPLTNGSNSIKRVLPAILAESAYLREKYRQPIYGSADGIRSLNFTDWVWLKQDDRGKIVDPYKQLPGIFEGIDPDKIDFTLMSGDELADGGAAMTAYAKMQFSEMSDTEWAALKGSLLKYCELDTLAMVMLYEHWAELTGLLAKKQRAA